MNTYSRLNDALPETIFTTLGIKPPDTDERRTEVGEDRESIIWLESPPSLSTLVKAEPSLTAFLISPTIFAIVFVYLTIVSDSLAHLSMVGVPALLFGLAVVFAFIRNRHLLLGYKVITTRRAAIVVPHKQYPSYFCT